MAARPGLQPRSAAQRRVAPRAPRAAAMAAGRELPGALPARVPRLGSPHSRPRSAGPGAARPGRPPAAPSRPAGPAGAARAPAAAPPPASELPGGRRGWSFPALRVPLRLCYSAPGRVADAHGRSDGAGLPRAVSGPEQRCCGRAGGRGPPLCAPGGGGEGAGAVVLQVRDLQVSAGGSNPSSVLPQLPRPWRTGSSVFAQMTWDTALGAAQRAPPAAHSRPVRDTC